MWGEGSDKVAVFEERDAATEERTVAEACAWRAQRFDAGFGLDHRAAGVRRARPAGGVTSAPTTRREPLPRARPGHAHDRPGHGRPDDPRPRHRRRQGALPRAAAPRRHRRLPAVLRARRRLRPGQPADPGRARRRRVGRHRPEGVDLGRPVQRHRRGDRPHRRRTCPSTRGSPASSSTSAPPAWRCARCAR